MTSLLFFRDKILELDRRREIYMIVKKYAGCHFRDIERKSKLPASSLKYHLDYLSKHGIISEEKEGNTICYFTKEFNTGDKRLLMLLRQESIRKILIYLITNKMTKHDDIVQFTKLSPSTVSWHLKKLIAKGIITKNSHAKKTIYTPLFEEKEIIQLLITYKESFLDVLVNKTIKMWEIN